MSEANMKPTREIKQNRLMPPSTSGGLARKRPPNTLQIRKRVSPQQWKILLDYMEETPELINVYTHTLWNTIAKHLNSIGLTRKTNAKWKSAVHDWKYKTKCKVRAILRERPKDVHQVLAKKLTENERRLVNICGWDQNLMTIEDLMDSCEQVIKIEPRVEHSHQSDSERSTTSSQNDFREDEIYLNSIDVKPSIDPLFHFENGLINENNKGSANPPLIPSSPPPLIFLQNKNLDANGRPKTTTTPPLATTNPRTDRISTNNSSTAQKEEVPTNSGGCPNELIEVLGSLASGIHGILGELKVISGTLQKIADK